MRIIASEYANKPDKRLYAAQEQAMALIDNDGWDSYDGRNYQYYTLFYSPELDIVRLDARNSGSCYGDYSIKYFYSAKEFKEEFNGGFSKDWRTLLGDIDEKNTITMKFVKA